MDVDLVCIVWLGDGHRVTPSRQPFCSILSPSRRRWNIGAKKKKRSVDDVDQFQAWSTHVLLKALKMRIILVLVFLKIENDPNWSFIHPGRRWTSSLEGQSMDDDDNCLWGEKNPKICDPEFLCWREEDFLIFFFRGYKLSFVTSAP